MVTGTEAYRQTPTRGLNSDEQLRAAFSSPAMHSEYSSTRTILICAYDPCCLTERVSCERASVHLLLRGTCSGNHLDEPLRSSAVVFATNEKEVRNRQQPIQGGPVVFVDDPPTGLGTSKTD